MLFDNLDFIYHSKLKNVCIELNKMKHHDLFLIGLLEQKRISIKQLDTILFTGILRDNLDNLKKSLYQESKIRVVFKDFKLNSFLIILDLMKSRLN